MGIENKLLVLKLNRNWQIVGQDIIQKALVDLARGINCFALDMDYPTLPNGEVDFDHPCKMNPVGWDEWITLPIRPWDFVIHTVKLKIRVPTVLIAKNYVKIPFIRFGKHPSAEQVRIRDNYICQYTGRKLKKDEISIDHVVPKSRGGDNSWKNVVTTSKEINSKKGDKLNSEIGLKLIRTPTIPKPMPRSELITEIRHADWTFFLKNKKN